MNRPVRLTRRERRRIIAARGFRCEVCGRAEAEAEGGLEVHHVEPFRWHENNEPENLLVLCASPCHAARTGLANGIPALYFDGVHLMAETVVELHFAARWLRLKHEWFQDHPRHPHYDVWGEPAERLRKQADKRAATGICYVNVTLLTPRDLIRRIRALKETP